MKKKLVALLVVLGLLSTFVGCGSSEQQSAEPETTPTVEEAPVQEVAQEVEEVEEPEFKTLNVSEWAADRIIYLSDKYLLVVRDGLASVCTYDGEAVDSSVLCGIENGFEFYYPRLDEGAVCLIRAGEDWYDNYLLKFNPDPELIYSEEGSDCYVSDYRSGILLKENEYEIYLIDVEKDLVLNWYDAGIIGGVYLSDNYIVVESMYLDMDVKAKSALLDVESLKKEGSARVQPYYYGDRWVNFNRSVVSDEGWSYCSTFTTYYDEEDGSYYADEGVGGVFNIYTNEFIEVDNVSLSYSYIYNNKGIGHSPVYKNFLKPIFYDENDNASYRIYDFVKQEFVTDNVLAIDLMENSSGNILFEDMDGKWGYFDADTFEVKGELYDDASDFTKGYALVNVDGLEYVINSDLEIISEGYEGNSAHIIMGEYSFFNSSIEPLFAVEKEDGYHLALVTD